MSYLIILLKLAIAAPILLFQIIFSFIFKIKIGKIDTSRIGNIFIADLYLRKKKINKSKIIELWVTDKKVCNYQMLKMLKKNFLIINFFRFYYDALIFLAIKINFFSKYLIELNGQKDYIYFDKIKNQIKLTEKEILKASNIAKIFKIPPYTKIICISSRDSSYLKKKYPKDNYSYHNYRDSEIKNLIPTIKRLIKKKYFVVRVGREAKEKINIKDKYFLDYPFSKFKNDLLDFYFAKVCCLWIGSNTGVDCLAFMFEKPMIIMNLSPIGVLLQNSRNKKIIYHFKTYSKNNKKITLNNIFKNKLELIDRTQNFKKKNIILHSASAKETSDICLEGINYFLKKKKFNINDKKNHKNFNKKLSQLYNFKNNIFLSILSPIFLKKNKWIID
jgi:putative glycosyltransferase (TIGR04372 family)